MVQEPRLDTLRLFYYIARNELVRNLVGILFGIEIDATFQGRNDVAFLHIGKQGTHIVEFHRAVLVERCAKSLHRVCGYSQFSGGKCCRMVKDVRLDVPAVFGAFQEEHFHSCSIHLDDVGVRLLVKVAPACNIVIIQVVEPAAVFPVFCMVLRLVVIETMIALPYFDIAF